ncbi:hypothetical protein ACLB2K_026746 [Fragaria x ananassa]
MPLLIIENQLAFVSGRQIQDNIIVAHELFHYLKVQRSGESGSFALKLDMNKAYDRVEWSFLEAVLLKMGFAGGWVSLIKQCISTISLSVLVNGKPGVFFKPTRGLCQGDPLSPFLFLFVNDVLSQILCKLSMVNILQPVQIGNLGPKIINTMKSSLYFSPNTHPHIVQLISYMLKMKAVKDPGKYLDQAAIQTIPLIDTDNEDKLIWPHQQSGSYTVQSGYHLAQATVTSAPKLKASSSHYACVSC